MAVNRKPGTAGFLLIQSYCRWRRHINPQLVVFRTHRLRGYDKTSNALFCHLYVAFFNYICNTDLT